MIMKRGGVKTSLFYSVFVFHLNFLPIPLPSFDFHADQCFP